LVTLVSIIVTFAMSLGCDSGKLKTYPVKGKVVFPNGSPVKVGTVETKSVDHGVQATGNIDLDGSFTLTTYRPNDGAVAGQHRCVVIQFVPVEEIPNYRPSTMGVVNRKHSTYSTSELTLTVKPDGPNEVQLVVQGADPILKSTDDHGHDPIPEGTEGKKDQ
jgi:ribosomal protein S12